MKVETRSRLLKGLAANIVGQANVAIVQLVGVPLLIHAWGVQLYGEWLILFAVPALLSMTDLGFSLSAANDMCQRTARGDRDGAQNIFRGLFTLVSVASLCAILVTTAIVFAVPFKSWMKLSAIAIPAAQLIIWLFAAEIAVRLLDGVSHAGYRATGRYSQHVILASAVMLVQNVSIWIVAFRGYGPVTAALCFFLVRAVSTPAIALLLVRRETWLRFQWMSLKRSELRNLVRPAIANLALPLGQAINVQGMVLLVGAILGPVAVVTFSALRTLSRITLQLVLVISHAAEPEMAAAVGTNDFRLLAAIFGHAIRAAFWLAIISSLGLLLVGDRFVAAWTHGAVQMNHFLFLTLLASGIATVLWYTGLTTLKSANRHLAACIVYTLSAGLAVLLSGVVLKVSGDLSLAGVGLLAMDATMAGYVLRSVGRLMGRNVPALLGELNPTPLAGLRIVTLYDR